MSGRAAATYELRGDLIELRLQSSSHLITEYGRIKPIETTFRIGGQFGECVDHFRFLSGAVPKDKPFLSLHQR